MPIAETIAATTATGTLWPIIRDSIRDAGGDFLTDKFKEAVKNLIPTNKDAAKEWQKAADEVLAKSLAKFIERAEVALEDADVEDVGAYTAAFKDLLASGAVQNELARGFLGNNPSSSEIAQVWEQMGLRDLPEGFDWSPILKQYQKTLTAAAGQTEVLKKALDTLNLARIADDTEASRPHTPGFDLTGYRKAIIATHSHLKLQQLAAEAQNKTPISMRKIFVDPNVLEQEALSSDFYCLPLEDQARLRAGSLEKHHLLDEQTIERFTRLLKKATPQNGIAFLTHPSQRLLVLTGDPGSGKSTLLQYLSLQWAEAPAPAAAGSIPVPLLIELRRYAEQREKNPAVTDFPSYLQHGTDQTWQLDARQVETALTSSQAWLLLDGFDEVFDPALRDEIIAKVRQATIAWRDTRIIVTTRSYEYNPEPLQQAGFLHAHIQPFTDDQVIEFLVRWHAQITDADKNDLHARLKRKVLKQERMRELAGNPLLLTMMALLNRTSDLPDRRAELYARCVDLLIHQWDAEVHRLPSGPSFGPYQKDSRQLSLLEKRALLRAVAFRMQKALALNVIDVESLKAALMHALPAWVEDCDKERVALELIRQLQGRNYILASLGGGRFGFVHRTFLEFCCADYYLFQLKEEGSLNEVNFFTQTFASRWQDKAWNEVLLLLASQLVSSRLQDVLKRVLQLTPLRSALCLAAKLLGESNNRASLESVEDQIWLGVIRTLEDALKKAAKKNKKSDKENDLVWSPLIEAVGTGWGRTTRGKDLLLDLALNGSNNLIKLKCLAELSHWTSEAQVRQALEKLLSENDEFVYYLSAVKLAEVWGSDREVLALFLTAYQRKINSTSNGLILYSLACGWGHDDEVKSLVLDGLDDKRLHLRQACVLAIPHLNIDDQTCINILKDKMSLDEHLVVRNAALDAFVEKFSDTLSLRTLLEQIVATEGNTPLKERALKLQSSLTGEI